MLKRRRFEERKSNYSLQYPSVYIYSIGVSWKETFKNLGQPSQFKERFSCWKLRGAISKRYIFFIFIFHTKNSFSAFPPKLHSLTVNQDAHAHYQIYFRLKIQTGAINNEVFYLVFFLYKILFEKLEQSFFKQNTKFIRFK